MFERVGMCSEGIVGASKVDVETQNYEMAAEEEVQSTAEGGQRNV